MGSPIPIGIKGCATPLAWSARDAFRRTGAAGQHCIIAAVLWFGLLGTASGAAEFASAKPTQRVEYWQHREVEVNGSVADTEKLRAVKLLFVGDSITDFWLLDDIPWAKGQKCGRKIWNESFNQPGSENFGLDLGISGDRTEHALYRLLPRSEGGAGNIDTPELHPEFIIVMIGINNLSDAEPVVDSMFEGIRAVVVALHERKPTARIILQSLLPIPDEAKNSNVVRPVNQRLAMLANSQPFAGFVSFLDLYPAFVDGSGKEIVSYFNDGTHPSQDGYRVWRDQLVPFLSKIRSASESPGAPHETGRPDVAASGSTAEPVGIDPLFTAPAASLSAGEVAALQARLADFAQLGHYRVDDERLSRTKAVAPRIVFLGDSITDNWSSSGGMIFSPGKTYLNRGISGQTTAQMLLRFRQDVINLHPAAVLILAGTNDIAGNTGASTLPMIEDNLRSMTELAKSNHIRVILASLLPVSDYSWRPGLRPAAKVRSLNAWIKRYAQSVGATYLDFHSVLTNAQGGMDAALASDGVHPTDAGYAIMTALARRAIDETLAR
jgi:lysophospholipase L1-like esterase